MVEAGQAVFKTAQTASDGTYSILEMFAGNYIACEVLQDGWSQSRPVAGQTLPNGETLATCPGGTTGYGFAINGTGGQTSSDFGNFQQGAVTGTKLKDKDDDGVRDAGEQGLSGREIHAFNANTHVHTTTAADGTYSFTLNPGTYTICETLSGQTGWVQSAPATGADCSGHTHGGTITPGATGYSVTVVSQGTVSARDFGNTPLSKVEVNFLPQATLPGGGDATHATSITCTPGGGTRTATRSPPTT